MAPETSAHDSTQASSDTGLTLNQPGLMEGLLDTYGLTRLTSLQQRAIPPILNRGNVFFQDVVVETRPGGGRFGILAIPILEKVDPKLKATQVIVLAPTKDIALQIQMEILALGRHTSIACYACIGGVSVREDLVKLREGPQIVVGTRGRLYDLMKREALRTDSLEMFCALGLDRLHQCGEGLYETFQLLRPETQIILLSSKMRDQELKAIERIAREPVRILEEKIEKKSRDFYICLDKEGKYDALLKLAGFISDADWEVDPVASQMVIFCSDGRQTEFLARSLAAEEDLEVSIEGEEDTASPPLLVVTSANATLAMRPAMLVIHYDIPAPKSINKTSQTVARKEFTARSSQIRVPATRVFVSFVDSEGIQKAKDLDMLRQVARSPLLQLTKISTIRDSLLD